MRDISWRRPKDQPPKKSTKRFRNRIAREAENQMLDSTKKPLILNSDIPSEEWLAGKISQSIRRGSISGACRP